MEFFRAENTGNAPGLLAGISSKVDSFITSKLFMYAWIYSMAKGSIGTKTIIHIVPGAAEGVSLALTAGLALVVMIAGALDYFISRIVGLWKAASDLRNEVRINPSHVAIALPMIFFIIWVVLG